MTEIDSNRVAVLHVAEAALEMVLDLRSGEDDKESLALYDAIRTLVSLSDFAELKRSKRPRLDLPLFAS